MGIGKGEVGRRAGAETVCNLAFGGGKTVETRYLCVCVWKGDGRVQGVGSGECW